MLRHDFRAAWPHARIQFGFDLRVQWCYAEGISLSKWRPNSAAAASDAGSIGGLNERIGGCRHSRLALFNCTQGRTASLGPTRDGGGAIGDTASSLFVHANPLPRATIGGNVEAPPALGARARVAQTAEVVHASHACTTRRGHHRPLDAGPVPPRVPNHPERRGHDRERNPRQSPQRRNPRGHAPHHEWGRDRAKRRTHENRRNPKLVPPHGGRERGVGFGGSRVHGAMILWMRRTIDNGRAWPVGRRQDGNGGGVGRSR